MCPQSENIAYMEEILNLKLLNLRKIMRKIYKQISYKKQECADIFAIEIAKIGPWP